MKRQERQKLMAEIKHELAKGEHTFTQCSCGKNGSRSGKCWECLLEELAK